ncbi:hypothetical protein Tco_0758976 [Tanacetum coccineum]
MGRIPLVRLELELRGFKAWILFLVSALGTLWDLLDQNLAAIVDLEEILKVKALDDVIYMGRRLDDFTKNVKVGGAGKKPIILSAYDIINISVEKWTVKLIGGVGKSITTGLKNTTNGRKKGLKLRVKVVADSEQNTITGSNHELGHVNSNSLFS